MPTLVFAALRAVLVSRACLVAEGLALRQRLAVLHGRLPRAACAGATGFPALVAMLPSALTVRPR